MEEWFTSVKLPIGDWMESVVGSLNENAQGFFDLVSVVLQTVIEALTATLLAIPPIILVALFAGGAWWLHRSWKLSLFIVLALLLIINLGYWQPTMETLSL